MPWGFYKRADTPEVPAVVLPANDEDQTTYAAKGYEYLGEAPSPGNATLEETQAALAKLKTKK